MSLKEQPASILLAHGAGSGPWVFRGWPESFGALEVNAVDLQAGLEVDTASHSDYCERVVEAARSLTPPVCLCGWSMGGLVVLEAADRVRPHSVVLLEASPPAEVQGFDPEVGPEPGSFDPEEVYGRFPVGMASRRESALARAERKRGISVPSLPCPSLVITGQEFPDDRGRAIAAIYGSEEVAFADLDHWGLVREPRVRGAIAAWLRIGDGRRQPQIA
jgi:pimeloyl-ACP methyl ester carboxylesterase